MVILLSETLEEPQHVDKSPTYLPQPCAKLYSSHDPCPHSIIVYSKQMHYLNNNILSISSLLWVNGWLKQL